VRRSSSNTIFVYPFGRDDIFILVCITVYRIARTAVTVPTIAFVLTLIAVQVRRTRIQAEFAHVSRQTSAKAWKQKRKNENPRTQNILSDFVVVRTLLFAHMYIINVRRADSITRVTAIVSRRTSTFTFPSPL